MAQVNVSKLGKKEVLVELMAVVVWRMYHKQDQMAIELMKNESKWVLFDIFIREGGLVEWSRKRGVHLEYQKLDVLPKREMEGGFKEDAPASQMGRKMSGLKGIGEIGKRSIISRKMAEYVKEKYPECHQQLHAHLM